MFSIIYRRFLVYVFYDSNAVEGIVIRLVMTKLVILLHSHKPYSRNGNLVEHCKCVGGRYRASLIADPPTRVTKEPAHYSNQTESKVGPSPTKIAHIILHHYY